MMKSRKRTDGLGGVGSRECGKGAWEVGGKSRETIHDPAKNWSCWQDKTLEMLYGVTIMCPQELWHKFGQGHPLRVELVISTHWKNSNNNKIHNIMTVKQLVCLASPT